MSQALEIPFGIRPTNKRANVDDRYGPYPSREDALTALSGENNTRAKGLVIGVETDGAIYEYIFKRGIEDIHLIPKDPYFFKYIDTLPTYDDLMEITEMEIGDFYIITAAHTSVPEFPANSSLAWNGTGWHLLPGLVDISGKLDKQNGVTPNTMLYAKLPGGGQTMIDITSIGEGGGSIEWSQTDW